MNSVIAVVLAVVVWAAVGALGPATAAVPLAVATLVASAASIYFRGYLVPGTPTLTKRYFPDRVLAYFDKGPGTAGDGGVNVTKSASWAHTYAKMPDPDQGPSKPLARTNVDPEPLLLEAGALEECEDVDDLCLTDDFKAEWEEHVEAVDDEDASRDRLLAILDVGDAEINFDEYETGFRVTANGRFAGRWESRAAFLADVAAGELLEDRIDSWDDLSMNDRGAVLNGLRLFIETCPSCGSPVSMNTRLVESCCREHKVAALACDECEARLFESDALDA